MKKIHVNGYKRITKHAAFTAYKNGDTIYLCPVNFAPGSIWRPEMPIKNDTPRKWEAIINEFQYYNCNSKAGKYVAFYIMEDQTK